MSKQSDKWEATISAVVTAYRELDGVVMAALIAGAMDPNGKLHGIIWKSFQELLWLVDYKGHIAWFICDNQLGKRGLEAGQPGKRKPIRTIKQLSRLIAACEREDRKQSRG